jgi:Uma2 family endonuclease
MSQTAADRVRWTTADLELLPDNGNRYEIINGELFVTRAPHWKHQRIADKICAALNTWSEETDWGEAATGAGVIFSDADNVIPDVVWVSQARLALILDAQGHLIAAPELVVEVVSSGEANERRDRQVKLKLYSVQGVQEYWIVDRDLEQIQVYRREQAMLTLTATLLKNDSLTTPLLPGFCYPIARWFA